MRMNQIMKDWYNAFNKYGLQIIQMKQYLRKMEIQLILNILKFLINIVWVIYLSDLEPFRIIHLGKPEIRLTVHLDLITKT